MRCASVLALLLIGTTSASAGGFSDKEVSPGVWRVAFALSAAQGGHDMAVARANYRAAQIAKAHGFAWMRYLNVKGFALDLAVGSTSAGDGPGYSQIFVRGATGPDDVEGCLAKDASKCATVKVDDVLARFAIGAR